MQQVQQRSGAAARHHEEPHGNVWLITITVMLGLIMAIVDTTIVNVALDNIGGNLGASIDEVSWVATGYILASVIVMPLNGYLTAFFGRRGFYAGCLAIFTISSFLCGTAHSITQLVFYRVIQGIGGGALQPTAQAILFETFPPERRGAAMAIFGMGAMVGPAIGPVLGGYLVDNYSWPLIFFVNVPIGITAFFMTMSFIPNPKYIARPKGAVDWFGLAMLATGLGCLQYVLQRGQHDDWWNSSTITWLAVISAVALVWFIVKTLRDKHPLVNLSVFRFRAFSVANIIGVVMGFGLYGTALVMPLFFQNIMGMTAYDAGIALLPGAIATAIAMPIVGKLVNHLDGRILVAFGVTLFAISTWLLGGLTQNAGYWNVFWPRVIQGFGLGFLFVPLTTVMLAPIPKPEMAGATGVSALVRQLGGSFGIAILTTLLARRIAFAWHELAAGITQTHGVSAGTLTGLVAQSSQVIGYDYLFRLTAIVFICTVPLCFFLRNSRRDPTAAPPIPMAE